MKKNKSGWVLLLVLIICYVIWWLSVCGLVALICLCFDQIHFTWLMGTGVWLITFLLRVTIVDSHKRYR